MEQCEPPRLAESKRGPVERREDGNRNGVGGKSLTTPDGYDCRICGYKAADVGSLSQHLRSVHPVTSLPGPSSLRGEKGGGKEEEDKDGDVKAAGGDGVQCPERRKSPPVENPELSEGSTSSLAKDSAEQSSRSTCTVENQVPEVAQTETAKNAPADKSSQSPFLASVLPRRKASCSSGSNKGNQSEGTASSGTSSLNRTHLVCLPLVSEGLKLVWVRSEQTHELDAVSELVEAFNAFPYPTEQEANALARRCSLPAERVKVWFMMQRVRYGISWGDDDIRETRRKLWRQHKMHLGEECVEDKEDASSDDLALERKTAEGQMQSFKQASAGNTYVAQMHHTPNHGTVLSQHNSIDYNGSAVTSCSAIPQYTNGLEQFAPQAVEAQSAFEHTSPHKVNSQSHININDIPPLEHEPESPSDFSYPAQLDGSIQHGSTVQYQSPTDAHIPGKPEPRAPTGQLRKKSKAQLMVLRRSFVHRNWPSEAEVQRLQRVTGLGRHEIRKWFADSRYQLRRSGRSWLSEDGRRSRRGSGRNRRKFDSDVYPSGGLFDGSEAVGSEGLDVELDVDMEDEQDPLMEGVSGSEARKEEATVDPEPETSIKQERKEIAIAPSPSTSSSSPSPSFIQGRVLSLGPEPNLRKKTQQQLDVLRQSFLCCQWPTSDDYTILQRKTGLTRTEIVQWFGDTRYHVKHNNMRWMTPEDRERIIAGITKQQRRGGRASRNKSWLEGADSGLGLEEPKPSNGTGGGQVIWNNVYNESPSALPGGEL
ncbi:homeobox and leucine zipper encoding b [Salminus brasiliensis]|uniref:homeobox and leucine zipper encoding b n=1 Tax=Salminus brasiliensis TaxID=930266 RepID=UPI003B82E4C4